MRFWQFVFVGGQIRLGAAFLDMHFSQFFGAANLSEKFTEKGAERYVNA
jgi:hypothetical protein